MLGSSSTHGRVGVFQKPPNSAEKEVLLRTGVMFSSFRCAFDQPYTFRIYITPERKTYENMNPKICPGFKVELDLLIYIGLNVKPNQASATSIGMDQTLMILVHIQISFNIRIDRLSETKEV